MTPEGKVKAKIKAYLKTIPNCWFFMPIGGPYTTHGVPDIVGSVDGYFFAIECKAPGKEDNTTANQNAVLGMIRIANGLALVTSDVADVKAIFAARGWDTNKVEQCSALSRHC